jgi:hypothetical protein
MHGAKSNESPTDPTARPPLEEWRHTVFNGRFSDADQDLVLRIIGPSFEPMPHLRTASITAGARFSTAAREAAALTRELALGDATRVARLRVRLHAALREALRGASVGDTRVLREKDDPHLILMLHRMDMSLADVLPPRAEALRGTKEFAAKIAAMGMVGRLNICLPPDTWSSDVEAFQRLTDNLTRVARWYREIAGAKRPAHRPSLRRDEWIRRAAENGLTRYQLAALLARAGHRSTPRAPEFPVPTIQYLTQDDYVTACNQWVKDQTQKHYALLKQVGRTKRTPAVKGRKVARPI